MKNIINNLKENKIVAIIRTDTKEKAINAAKACIDGGIKVIEFTMTIPGAFKCVEEVLKFNSATVGIGTITDKKTLKAAFKTGAHFFVSPHLDIKMVKLAKKNNALFIPGVSTATEIQTAVKNGAKVIKLFPVNCIGGTECVKALLGPYPELNIFATGGISDTTFTDYLASGALCTGIGGSLFKKEWIDKNQFENIMKKAKEIMSKV